MALSKKVFVSYCHSEPDSSLASTFVEALSGAGHIAFIDTKIQWGTEWARIIRSELEKADFLLVLLSQNSSDSIMVREEIKIGYKLFQEHGSPELLPIRISLPFDHDIPYDISAILSNIQQLTWTHESETSQLVDFLLGRISQSNAPAFQNIHSQLNTPSHFSIIDNDSPSMSEGIISSYADPRDFIRPGGAISLSNEHYIEPNEFDLAKNEILKKRSVVTIKGPRQFGKTSMMIRLLHFVKTTSNSTRVAFIDFQSIENEFFSSHSKLWKRIIDDISFQIEIASQDRNNWDHKASTLQNLNNFVEYIFDKSTKDSLLICLDEADRVLTKNIGQDFFGLIRAIYNRGAIEQIWRRINWCIATSTEPSYYLTDINQSPFNIGLNISLPKFNYNNIISLASKMRIELHESEIHHIAHFLGGHPYLTHLLLFHVKSHPKIRSSYFSKDSASRGIFRDHLNRILINLASEEKLIQALKMILSNRKCNDYDSIQRLETTGIIMTKGEEPVISSELYKQYFLSVLYA